MKDYMDIIEAECSQVTYEYIDTLTLNTVNDWTDETLDDTLHYLMEKINERYKAAAYKAIDLHNEAMAFLSSVDNHSIEINSRALYTVNDLSDKANVLFATIEIFADTVRHFELKNQIYCEGKELTELDRFLPPNQLPVLDVDAVEKSVDNDMKLLSFLHTQITEELNQKEGGVQ